MRNDTHNLQKMKKFYKHVFPVETSEITLTVT